jgi:hypothetical protein
MDINEFEIEAHRRIEVEIELKQKSMDNFFKISTFQKGKLNLKSCLVCILKFMIIFNIIVVGLRVGFCGCLGVFA